MIQLNAPLTPFPGTGPMIVSAPWHELQQPFTGSTVPQGRWQWWESPSVRAV